MAALPAGCHALPHLVGGLVGEGDRQNAGTRDAVRFHQVRHAVRDDARLAAAGAGQQQERSFDVRDGSLLLRIQALKKIHGGGDMAILARAGEQASRCALSCTSR